MKFLVTGATGFVGGHLTERLLADGHQVLSLGRRPQPVYAEHPAYQEFVLPLPPPEHLLPDLVKFKPNAVLHAAAASSGRLCEEEPETAQLANSDFPAFLARAACLADCFLCALSTDLVFDGGKAPPGGFREGDLPRPRSVYARTKLAGEQAVLSGEGPTCVLRSSLIYGPSVGERQGVLAWMLDGFRAGRPVTLFRDEWRTPIYVGDVVETMLAAARNGLVGLFHVAGPERLSRVEFGTLVARTHGFSAGAIQSISRADVDSVPSRPEDVSLDAARITSRLGLSFLSPSEGLERTAQTR